MSVLKMAFHRDSGRRMVEVYDSQNRIVAAIYPSGPEGDTIKIVTKHDYEVVVGETPAMGPIPALIDITIAFHFDETA